MIVIRVLHAELTVCIHSAVDHLRIVIIPLRLYLMSHVFLEDIVRLILYLLRILYRCHHVGAGGQMGIVPSLKWFELILPRSHNGLIWICGTHIIILEAFGAGDSICSIARYLLGAHAVIHPILISTLRYELWILLGMVYLRVAIMIQFLLPRIKRNLNSTIGVP